VTVIVHSAWTVDVYMNLAEFEAQIAGMRNFLLLGRAATSRHSPKFLYVSSLLISQSWDPTMRLYPENEIVEPETAEGTGWGESEYVSHIVRLLMSCQCCSDTWY
jgi:hypothetical protein